MKTKQNRKNKTYGTLYGVHIEKRKKTKAYKLEHVLTHSVVFRQYRNKNNNILSDVCTCSPFMNQTEYVHFSTYCHGIQFDERKGKKMSFSCETRSKQMLNSQKLNFA